MSAPPALAAVFAHLDELERHAAELRAAVRTAVRTAAREPTRRRATEVARLREHATAADCDGRLGRGVFSAPSGSRRRARRARLGPRYQAALPAPGPSAERGDVRLADWEVLA